MFLHVLEVLCFVPSRGPWMCREQLGTFCRWKCSAWTAKVARMHATTQMSSSVDFPFGAQLSVALAQWQRHRRPLGYLFVRNTQCRGHKPHKYTHPDTADFHLCQSVRLAVASMHGHKAAAALWTVNWTFCWYTELADLQPRTKQQYYSYDCY